MWGKGQVALWEAGEDRVLGNEYLLNHNPIRHFPQVQDARMFFLTHTWYFAVNGKHGSHHYTIGLRETGLIGRLYRGALETN